MRLTEFSSICQLHPNTESYFDLQFSSFVNSNKATLDTDTPGLILAKHNQSCTQLSKLAASVIELIATANKTNEVLRSLLYQMEQEIRGRWTPRILQSVGSSTTKPQSPLVEPLHLLKSIMAQSNQVATFLYHNRLILKLYYDNTQSWLVSPGTCGAPFSNFMVWLREVI